MTPLPLIDIARAIKRNTLNKISYPVRPAGHFVIISQFRSGSTLMRKTLNTHPDILCHGELSNPAGAYCRAQGLDEKAMSAMTTDALTAWGTNTLMEQVINPRLPFYRRAPLQTGYKFLCPHIKFFPACADFYRKHDFRIVYVWRRHLLARETSAVIAVKEQYWHSKARQHNRPTRIELDVTRLEKRFKTILSQREEAENLFNGLPSYKVFYEDIIGDPDYFFRTIFDFLNLDPDKPWHIPTEKRNPYPLEDMIANYDEVRARLENTAYGFCLEEPPAKTI